MTDSAQQSDDHQHDEDAHLLVGDPVEVDLDLPDVSTFEEDSSDEDDVDYLPLNAEPMEAGASWYAAPCINALIRDLDAAFPNRTKPDWVVGDTAHSYRVSDHNPDAGGMVHAIDIRLGGGLDPSRVLKAVIGDPRTWYVIFNRVIYSRTYNWAPRAYTGANPHTTHIHVSVLYTDAAERDTRPWGPMTVKVVPRTVDLSVVQTQFRKASGLLDGEVERRRSIARVQACLNAKMSAGLRVDGIVGPKTIRAFKEFEEKVGGVNKDRIPDYKSLPRLVEPKWKVVA